MSEDFIPDILETLTVPPSPSATPEPTPHREPVKISIIGSRRGVNSIIRTLYRLRFAEVIEWSPLQPTGNPGEFVSMLIRQISTY
ncbi:MAG: peptide ABC transporter substrate-binding protein [Coleofasciculus sp. B1-GNL1-01]|uniref:peptide ABC transporter substrate-binding protein n=1 Tax=Coleofasciculus sp. B1-GNL1-01 TaxID=3068484 RepID=UPI0032FEBCBE